MGFPTKKNAFYKLIDALARCLGFQAVNTDHSVKWSFGFTGNDLEASIVWTQGASGNNGTTQAESNKVDDEIKIVQLGGSGDIGLKICDPLFDQSACRAVMVESQP